MAEGMSIERKRDMRITSDLLHRWCDRNLDTLEPRTAADVIRVFPGDARWILDPRVFQRAAELCKGGPRMNQRPRDMMQPPPLPQRPGCCCVPIVNRLAEQCRLLRRAFLLPLQWRVNTGHDPKLPNGLTEIANQVCALLVEKGRVSRSEWGLHLAPATGVEAWDLSELGLDGRSAWPSLACGLILAADGRRPDTQVWSTGEWNGSKGFVDIDQQGLEDKLDLAVEFGVRTFFVPPGQVKIAEAHLATKDGHQLRVHGFDTPADNKFMQATRRYMSQAGVPPGRDEPFEARRQHYLDQVETVAKREYYISHLLPELAAFFRSQFPPGLRWTHLVTVASDSPELVPLMVTAAQPQHCLLLFTDNYEGQKQAAEVAIRKTGVDCSVLTTRFSLATIDEDFRREIAHFTEGVPAEHVLIDLTPGNKVMSLSLAFSAAPRAAYLIYVRHEYEGKLVKPALIPPLLRQAGHSVWTGGASNR